MMPAPDASPGGDNPFREFIDRYQDDPVGFALHVLGVTPDEWQGELMLALAAGERRISVASGHGVGKSAVVSWIAVWAICTHSTVKVVVTAPSGPQLWDALFSEIKLWLNALPPALRECFDAQTDRIEHRGMPESIFISARTSRAENPEALQGVHAEGGRVILIADEASGVPEQVFEAAAGSMSGRNCTTILLGNPTRTSGFFFDTHHRLREMWWTRTVSCLTSERVDPDFIADMQARYGEDSNAYRVRVLGQFPRSDDDTLISLELVQAAMERDIAIDDGAAKYWGVDVARFGTDRSVLTKRWGRVVPEKPRAWRGLDLMQLCGAIKAEWDATGSQARPIEIFVDVIGIGAGVVDRLREMGLPVRGINVAESPAFDPNGQYLNLRAELWGKGKAWLMARDCRLPQDENLLELAVPRYSFGSNGKMKIESKEDMKKRGLRSPDFADSFLLTLAGDAAIASSSGPSRSWSTPMRRRIRGVV